MVLNIPTQINTQVMLVDLLEVILLSQLHHSQRPMISRTLTNSTIINYLP